MKGVQAPQIQITQRSGLYQQFLKQLQASQPLNEDQNQWIHKAYSHLLPSFQLDHLHELVAVPNFTTSKREVIPEVLVTINIDLRS